MKIFFTLMIMGLCHCLAAAPANLAFVEIVVTDLARAKSFYEKTLGWKFIRQSESFEMIDGMGIPAGMLQVKNEDYLTGKNVKLFFEVKDLENKLQAVVNNGGKIELHPIDVGTSLLAEFTDSEGNLMGMTCLKPCE